MNILITGANSEIAQAVALSLQFDSNKLILTSRNAERLGVIYSDFDKSKNFSYSADLSTPEGQSSLISFINEKFDELDAFIHVAGIYHDNGKAFSGVDFKNFTGEQIRENIEVTSLAPAIIINSLATNLSSDFRFVAITGTFPTAKGWLPYYLGKKSLESLVLGLTDEFPEYNFNAISPGDTLTSAYRKYFPEYATEENCILPSDIAQYVNLLLSEKGKFLNGQIIEVKK